MRSVLVILTVLLFASQTQAVIYYVDSSITDTNVASATPDFTTYNSATFSTSTGSASVFKTIADVNAKTLSAGDSMLFRQGQTWRETFIAPSSGSSGNVITYGAFGSGAAPIITGANSMTGFSNGGSNIWDKTSVTTQPLVVMIGATIPKPPAASRAACTTAGDWFWTANTLSVYATSDPSGTVEASQRSYAIQTNDKTYLTFSGLTIRGGNASAIRTGGITSIGLTFQNCTVEHAAVEGFELASTGTSDAITIDSCTIQDNGGSAIQVYGQYTSGTISNNTITRNGFLSLVSGNHCSSIQNKLGGLSIFNNDISDSAPNGSENAGVPGIFTHAIYYYGGDRTQVANIYNNRTFDNHYGAGIKIRGSSNVHHNLTYGNAAEGIQIAADDATNTVINVYYNIVYGNNTGNSSAYNGIVQQGKGAGNIDLSLYNNVVYGNSGTSSAEIFITNVMTVLNLKNNILFTSGARRTIDIEATQTGTVSINNNLHWRADGNPNIWHVGGKTWAQWQALGYDANGVNANPLLTNPGTFDFRLQSGSPAINVGANLGSTYQNGLLASSSWPTSVLTGDQNSFGAGWEIGAYIYGSSVVRTSMSGLIKLQGSGVIR